MSTPAPGPARGSASAPAFAPVPAPAPAPPAAGSLTQLPERPLFRILAYYVLLFAGAAAVIQLWPEVLPFFNAPLPVSTFLPSGMGHDAALQVAGGEAPGPWHVVLATVVALASACLLMLPVTWMYVQTRRKKGFRQSVVQTLIILPLVVAGVILLVQNSTALAFSLGGIVGAVSFRNTLRDTKDTIYIFLAIVVGCRRRGACDARGRDHLRQLQHRGIDHVVDRLWPGRRRARGWAGRTAPGAGEGHGRPVGGVHLARRSRAAAVDDTRAARRAGGPRAAAPACRCRGSGP